MEVIHHYTPQIWNVRIGKTQPRYLVRFVHTSLVKSSHQLGRKILPSREANVHHREGELPELSSVYSLRLSQLRVLSFRSNRLSGPIPADLSNLKSLRNDYLHRNQFSGGFPPSLTSLTRLTSLGLSSNNFTGPIPFSLNNLTHLTGLFLQSNAFSGKIPNIGAPLDAFDVSDNRLNGSIPAALARFPSSAFSNNFDLCGAPLPSCNPFFLAPAPSPTSSNSSPITCSSSTPLSTNSSRLPSSSRSEIQYSRNGYWHGSITSSLPLASLSIGLFFLLQGCSATSPPHQRCQQ